MPEHGRPTSDNASERAATSTAATTDQASIEADEHGHAWGSDVERVEHGFAPSIDPSNIKSREQREAEAREEAGEDVDAPLLKDGRPLTDAEETARYQRLRSYPSVPPVETRSVIVNGVAMLLPAGESATETSIPEEAKEVLENTAASRRTGQMKGLGNGLRTYDLTVPEGTAGQPQGSPSERIKASAEATTAEAEAERRAASAGTPTPGTTTTTTPPPPPRASKA